jgi:uncharacterized membrane protein YhfC
VGIVIAAVITVVLGCWIFQKLAQRLRPEKTALIICFLVSLPMSPAANLALKQPVLGWLQRVLAVSRDVATWPLWFGLLGLLVVAVTEETVKVLALLVPRLRNLSRTQRGAALICLAVGFGFGFGEALFLAWQIYMHRPDLAALPFYKLSGFIGERTAVMLLHSAFLVFPLSQLSAGRFRFIFGVITAILAHALVDLPAGLYQMKVIGFYATGIFVAVPFIALIWFLLRFIDGASPRIPSTNEAGATVLYRR